MHTSKLVGLLVVPVLSDQSTYHSVTFFMWKCLPGYLAGINRIQEIHKDTIRQHAEHWVRVSDHVYGALSH